MDEVKVWQWRAQYVKAVRDGVFWSLELEYGGKKVKSGGQHGAPSDDDVTAVVELSESKVFKKFQQAVRELADENEPAGQSLEVEGTYTAGFEASVFRPSAEEYKGQRWWLSPNKDFNERYKKFRPNGQPRVLIGPTVFVRMRGRLVGPGKYGHLGSWRYEFTVDQVLEMTTAPPKASLMTRILEDDFKTFAFLKKGKLVRPGDLRINRVAGTATLSPGVGWVRPALAGFTAVYTIDLEFPPLANDGEVMDATLGFVLSNKQIGHVRFYRKRSNNEITSCIQITRMAEDSAGPTEEKEEMLREFARSADLASGLWALHYQHGLVVITQAGDEVARGYLGTAGAAVIGVNWIQKRGKLTCRGMQLDGVLPPPRSEEEQTQLQKASRLNEKGLMLCREGKVTESLGPIKQASDLYLSVLGEEHHDTANSFYNLATVLLKEKRFDEARVYYERALRVRKKVLGPAHPETALVLGDLGRLMLSQGKIGEARNYLVDCLPILEQTYGKDHRRTRNLANILDKLKPKPQS
jgi:tetratricopeptide (TPR) repeat protein